MRTTYRGYEIDVRRENSLAGYDLLYYYIMRIEDKYMPVDGFEDSEETVLEMVKNLKMRIDAELAEDDPWLESEGY